MDRMLGRKRAIAFTIDAILALLIIIAMIPIFNLLASRPASTQTASQYLHLEAADTIDVLSKTRIRDVRSEPVIDEMFTRVPPALTDADLNLTLLDVLGGLWASQNPQSLADAQNITGQLFGSLLPADLKWSFSINGTDVIYNSTVMNLTNIVSASRKAASGFARNKNSSGFVARAFLENIIGKEDSAYFFFGGFIGEGNVTAAISQVPVNSTVSSIYLEANAESNFSMCLNNDFANCLFMNVSGGNFTVDNWTIYSNNSFLSAFAPGGMNNFTFIFTHTNITKHYFGGGFLKVTYTTSQLIPYINNTVRYPFPGIDGLLNLYDSFYVPGNITSMNAFIRLYSYYNYTTLGLMGNTIFLNYTGTNLTDDIIIDNANFTQLLSLDGITVLDLSQATIPLRLLTGANITGGKLNGTVDVVLITDTSGSMDWRMNLDSISGNWLVPAGNCDDTAGFDSPLTKRIEIAKCLDKDFVRAILGSNNSACVGGTPILGNRVALIDFSSGIGGNTSLMGLANLSYMESEINSYAAVGSTCIACAINRAWEILNSQSTPTRQKYVVVMTDGVANYRATNTCFNANSIGASNTDQFISHVVHDAGEGGVRTDGQLWAYQTLPTTQTLNGIAMLNSTFAFAVANAGEIYFWNGASWALSQDIGGTNLYAADIWNGTFAFASGSSGQIYTWGGSSWALSQDTGGQAWSAVTIVNSSWAFVGDSGGSEDIFRWDGSGWALHSDVGQDIYSLDAFNSTYALAGTSSERVFRWTGGSSWTQVGDLGFSNIRGIAFVNSSLAFGVSSSGEVSRWLFGSGSNIYTQPGSRQLNSITILNSSEGYAVGDYGRVILWDGNYWNVSASLQYAYEGNLTSGNSCNDGDVDNCGNFINQSYSALNANYSSARVFATFNNITIDSVGFGPIGSCAIGNNTIEAIAASGNGTAYSSTNASELRAVYCQIALNINTKKTQTQEITFSGNLTHAIIYPESYIEFQYIPANPAPAYKEIEVTSETDTFPGCTGSFFIPQVSRIIDAKMTSYSGNYWTSAAYVNSSATSGFDITYNLTSFNLPYTDMGDAFHVYLPVGWLRINEMNYVRDELGLNRTQSIINCSTFNRVIYTARLKASTTYGNIFPNLVGKNVTVYYDTNHDGIWDGFTYVAFGADLPPCGGAVVSNCFEATPTDVSSLTSCSDPNGDAMDCAILTLLDQLNYVIIPSNTGDAGESTNPIDIIIGGEIDVQTNTLQLVPIPWGPVDMTISVWV
ncbi:MAG: vWA domain-containing protein [Candidatus Micrarchaeota archaeon]